MQNIVGYSSIKQLGTANISIGVTGNTGPFGNTGPDGLGLTGNTGSNIIGITLVDRYIVTSFSDGTTYSTTNKVYGSTGGYTYIVDYLNLGSGISIGYAITGSNELLLRPIKIVNNTTNNLSITADPNSVVVNLATIGGTGVTLVSNSAFTDAYLLKFKSGNLRRIAGTKGVTSGVNSFYGLDFVNSNLFERVRGMGWTGSTGAVFCQNTGIGITCAVNPFVAEYDNLMYGSTSKIFVGDFSGNTASISIATCPNDGNAYGFEMYITNAKNPASLQNRFTSSSPIRWPLNKPPCFSVDGVTCDIRISFFGLQGVWYATAKHLGEGLCEGDGMFYTTCSATEMPTIRSASFSIIGACCKKDGSCSETTAIGCDGYFHGIGTTCGNTYSSICNKPGACCVSSTGELGINCFNLTSSECIGISFASFAGNGTQCESIECSDIRNNIGACCDGLGRCSELSESECDTISGFYQGVGTKCVNSITGISVCSTGTGPCCINGNCSELSGSECFEQNGYFLGTGRACEEFECPDKISCLGYINGVPIKNGQEYAGGVIVGKYEPGRSKILGATQLFNPADIASLDGTTAFNCSLYESFLDHTAYGITKNCSFDNEAYIIVVYPSDLVVGSEKTFSWGVTGSSWGPLLDSGGNYYDFVLNPNTTDPNKTPVYYYDTHLKYGEGYWSSGITAGVTAGLTALNDNLLLKTFPTCSASLQYGNSGVSRVFAKSPYGLHGVWHHSWGLYNTIRSLSANNAYVKKTSLENIFKWSDFSYSTQIDAFRATRTLSDGVTSAIQGITGNIGNISGWYLPSHDEMAFIAASTSNLQGFNINTHLMLVSNGEGLNGKYWTSTGTFDYTNGEGVYSATAKPNPGSVAIAFEMDINGNTYNVYKAKRKEKYKVRPIRMIRCDGTIPQNRYLWLLPTVINSKANQRNIDTINIETI
jgi:hypothetical protein